MKAFPLLTACLVFLSVAPAMADHHEWHSLFDGRTLMGWQSNPENPTSFSIEDGAIKVAGKRSHLFYVGTVNDAKFADFELKAKVKTMEKANAGIYFHTKYEKDGWPSQGYEAQVNTSHPDPRKTGSLYAVQDVNAEKLKETGAVDGEWFDYYIRVYGKHVTIKINGKELVNYTQPENPDHLESMPGRIIGTGTFALQAHDPGSVVYFKDIVVRPLK